MGVTTVVIAGIPQYVTLTDVARNLDNLFTTALNEVGNFHLRDLPNNSYTNSRQIAVDFDSSYSALVAQKILDEYEYKLPNGKQYILHADISRTKISVREIEKSSASPSPEKITYKRGNYKDESLSLVSKSYEKKSLSQKCDEEIDQKLEVLKKQKELLAMQRKVLKEKKKLKKEMKDFKSSDSGEIEDESDSEKSEKMIRKSRHRSSSSSSESSEEEERRKKWSRLRRDHVRSSKHHRRHRRSRSRCRSKDKSRRRKSRSSRSSSIKRRKRRSQSQDRSYYDKRLNKENDSYDGLEIVPGSRSDFSFAVSRKRRRSRSRHHSEARSRSSLRFDDKYSRTRSIERYKETTSTPEEDRPVSKVYNDSYEVPSSSRGVDSYIAIFHENAAKILMRDIIQTMFYKIVLKEKMKMPPKDFKALYMLLTKALIKRLQNLPVIKNEPVRDIVKRYADYYDTNDNYSMLRNIFDNFRADVIILDDEDEIGMTKSSRLIIDESTSSKHYRKSSRSEKWSHATYRLYRDDTETEDCLILEDEETQQIVPYCPNPSMQTGKTISGAKEIVDGPLLPPFVPCNTVEIEEQIEREIPANPKFVLPTRVLIKQMRIVLSDLSFDEKNGSTKVLRRVISRKLRSIMAGKEYMNTASIVRLFREHHPKTDDKEFLQNILDNIKAGMYPDEDSDTGDVCSEGKTVLEQSNKDEHTNHRNMKSEEKVNLNVETSQKASGETNDNSKTVHEIVIDTSNDDIIEIQTSENNTAENNSNDIIEMQNPDVTKDIVVGYANTKSNNESQVSQNNLNDGIDNSEINKERAVGDDILENANQKKSKFVMPINILLQEMKDHLTEVNDSKSDAIKLVIQTRLQQLVEDKEDLNDESVVSLFRKYHSKHDDNIFIQNIVKNFASGKINNVYTYVETELVGEMRFNHHIIKESQEVNKNNLTENESEQVKDDEKEYIKEELTGGREEVTNKNLNEIAHESESKVKDDGSFGDELTQRQADVTGEILNEIADELHAQVKDDEDLSILTVTFNTSIEYKSSTEDLLKVLSEG